MAPAPSDRPPPSARARRRRDALYGLALVLPLLLWLGLTILYPLAASVRLSLLDVKVIGTAGSFVGLDNYARVLSDGPFWQAMGRSLLWVAGNAVLQTVLALATALAIRERFPGVRLVRTWVILSWIVPTVVVVIVWRWLLNASGGVVNAVLVGLGVIDRPVGFFGTADAAFLSVVVINSWRWFPFMAVIVLAGLLRIPDELYEAARIDGAGRVQTFLHITLPGLRPTMFVLGLVGTLLSFNVFDVIWLLTAGGPSGATTTAPVLIYDTAFKQYRLSEAAAISVLVGLFLAAFAVLFLRFARPEDGRAA